MIKQMIVNHILNMVPANLQTYVTVLLLILYALAESAHYINKASWTKLHLPGQCPDWLDKAESVLFGNESMIKNLLKKRDINLPDDKPEEPPAQNTLANK